MVDETLSTVCFWKERRKMLEIFLLTRKSVCRSYWYMESNIWAWIRAFEFVGSHWHNWFWYLKVVFQNDLLPSLHGLCFENKSSLWRGSNLRIGGSLSNFGLLCFPRSARWRVSSYGVDFDLFNLDTLSPFLGNILRILNNMYRKNKCTRKCISYICDENTKQA